MAKIKSYTDDYGVTHPNCVWVPMFLAVDHIDRKARFVFHGFHDLQALAAGKQSLPGAQKEYTVNGTAYLTLIGSPPKVESTLLGTVADALYSHAMATKDTLTDPANPESAKVSFFKDCADVALG